MNRQLRDTPKELIFQKLEARPKLLTGLPFNRLSFVLGDKGPDLEASRSSFKKLPQGQEAGEGYPLVRLCETCAPQLIWATLLPTSCQQTGACVGPFPIATNPSNGPLLFDHTQICLPHPLFVPEVVPEA